MSEDRFDSVEEPAQMKQVRTLMEQIEEFEQLEELLEEQRPPNQKGEPHMIACPCPKCTPQV